MEHILHILPKNRRSRVPEGTVLMDALRTAGAAVDAPCGGSGRCGKCTVLADGQSVLACQTVIDRDMTVWLPPRSAMETLTEGAGASGTPAGEPGTLLAFDIGTTTLVGYLLDGTTGATLASAAMTNPQTAYGGDVVSRLRAARNGAADDLRRAVVQGMESLTEELFHRSGRAAGDVKRAAVVGNPAMQQLFMGLDTENLRKIPFAPVLTRAERVPAAAYLPFLPAAELLVVPDLAGYVGADTLGCVLACGLENAGETTLLLDIGTNGEMVLCDGGRMAACAAAAGPALEGAEISCGMRSAPGAIDRVWNENGALRCHVIGGGEAVGICGSGLVDAAAAALEAGLLDGRGRLTGGVLPLSDGVTLSQEDIRRFQLAKGAIAAGIGILQRYLGAEKIERVLLAGAFGSFLNPDSAVTVGLLPPEVRGRISAVGNAAGSGARMLACQPELLQETERLCRKIEFVELSAAPDFPRAFARQMRFPAP